MQKSGSAGCGPQKKILHSSMTTLRATLILLQYRIIIYEYNIFKYERNSLLLERVETKRNRPRDF